MQRIFAPLYGIADEIAPDGGDFDLILVPGGRGTRAMVDDTVFVDWLAKAAAQAEIVAVVGGGITAESDPALEYEETLHKAAGIVRALGTDIITPT